MSAAAPAPGLFELPGHGRPGIREAVLTVDDLPPDIAAMNRREPRLASLEREMREARNYAAWRAAAMAWDREAGREEWKLADASALYDYPLVQRRLSQILAAREGGYVRRLMFHLQEGLHGNLGNLSNPMLYQCCRFGTKRLIERYLDEVCESLRFLAQAGESQLSSEELLEFFESTSQAFGQSCLMLSGGAALGVYHLGVVKSLWEHGLLPAVVSGSSAGSIVAAILGTHTDAELDVLFQSDEPFVDMIRRNRPALPYLFDEAHFSRELGRRVPEMSFQEAFSHSGRAINITVSTEDRHSEGRLLNHRTSPTVLVCSAVRASCAAPFLLPPSGLLARTLGGETVPYLRNLKFLDGSIGDDLPIRRLTRLYGVNHSIVSLVNPLVLPFVSRRAGRGDDLGSLARRFITRIAKESANLSLEVLQRGLRSENAGLAIEKLQSVMMQEYRGDITLVPPRRLGHLLNMLRNHSPEEERGFVSIGMRITWPHLEMIKNTTAISRTFRQCIADLRAAPPAGPRRGAAVRGQRRHHGARA